MKHFKARTYGHASIWISAGLVGVLAVFYARLINMVQSIFTQAFQTSPLLVSCLTPLLFLAAAALVRKLAPDAKGSGIPQVLEAIDLQDASKSSLVSIKTAVIKVLSSMLGILAGASIGREGPTVQISASIFAWIGKKSQNWIHELSLQSYLVAGAAAGISAAFNTPLAGITFALEEISHQALTHFRQTVMLAVIIAGITAQAFSGNYLYFGHPIFSSINLLVLPQALLIGIVAGSIGGLFSNLLAYPGLTRLPKDWWVRALICGIACSAIGYFTRGDTAGSGYEVTRQVLSASHLNDVDLFFPLWKLITTVLSYLSGMAGGIFSPCLSIGAGIGISIAKLLSFINFKACALMGMVAFFAGAVQAPLTAIIIVTEMTDEHILVLPFMVAAFVGHGIGTLIMPTPLYRYLAQKNVEA